MSSKKMLNPRNQINRHDVIVSRIQTGYTKLFHLCLINKKLKLTYNTRHCIFSVKHIFLKYHKHYSVCSLSSIDARSLNKAFWDQTKN